MKKTNTEALKELFFKKQVLDLEDLYKALGTSSRRTVCYNLSKLDYLSSYSHAGKFYTLREIAKFDQDGLWYCGDIGFSKYGTLVETIVHIIEHSEAGKTNSELEKQHRLRVQNALLDLAEKKKIAREKVGKIFVYISSDISKGQKQMKNRREIETSQQLPEWLVFEVLIETIRASSTLVSADIVAARLVKRGSSISAKQVQQVFKMYDLEKKTQDSLP